VHRENTSLGSRSAICRRSLRKELGIEGLSTRVSDLVVGIGSPHPFPRKRVCLPSWTLKGPKHEIFQIGFFTQIRPIRVGDLGTGEKKIKFRKLESFFVRFSLRKSY
jgi:hypothetical protein